MLNCPLKILIGPLRGLTEETYTMSLNSEIGDYIHSPNIKAFSQIPGDKKGLELDYTLTHFNQILAQLPSDWQPDVVIWWDMTLHAIPPGIEDCPFPTIGVAGDWYMNINNLVYYARAFDHILGDHHIINILKANNIDHCSYWPCFGFDHHLFFNTPCDTRFDISFIGHLNARIHQKRNQLLQRVARLGQKYTVFIGEGLYGEDCRKIFNQSRIVFNYGGVGQVMNKRAYEVPACGALLFMEENNQETESILPNRKASVLYNEDNLEELLCYYLENEDLRSAIAAEGYQRIQPHSYQNKFAQLLHDLPTILKGITPPRSFADLSVEQQYLTVAKQLYYPVTKGSSDRAIAHLQKYFDTHTQNQSPHLLNIWAVLILQASQQTESHQLAETLLITALKSVKHPILLLNLGLLYQKQQQSEKALSSFQASIQGLKDSSWKLEDFENLLLYFNNSSSIEAQEALHIIIRWERAYFTHLNSTPLRRQTYTQLLRWYIWYQIAKVYQQENNIKNALQALEKAVEAFPSIPKTHEQMALLYVDNQQPLKAISAYTEAFNNNPFQAEHLLQLAQLLYRQKQFEQLQKILKDDWHLWTECPVFKSVKDRLLAYYHISQILNNVGEKTRFKTLLKQHYSQTLLSLIQQEPLLAHLATPTSLSLSLNPLESLPPIPNQLALLSPQSEKTLHIGEDTQPEPPLNYKRIWASTSDLNKGLVGLDHIPYLFPQNLPELDIAREQNESENLLVLIESYQNSSNHQLLTQCYEQFGSQYQYWLWSPFSIPKEEELEQLEANLPSPLIAQLELLVEDFSIAEQASFLKSFDIIFGNIPYYFWWSLFLSQATIFYGILSNPYEHLENSVVELLTYPCQAPDLVLPTVQTIHDFLRNFQKNEMPIKIENLLWQLKIDAL